MMQLFFLRLSGQLNKIVRDLLQEGEIEQTIPDKPYSSLQKYRLTPAWEARLMSQKDERK